MDPLGQPKASATFEHPEIYIYHKLISKDYIAVFTTKNINLFTTDLKTQKQFDRNLILKQFCELMCTTTAFSDSVFGNKFVVGCWMEPWSTYRS